MSAYLIVHRRNISDPDALKAYSNGVEETIRQFGGEVIVRRDDFDVLEGDWTPGKKHIDTKPERITIVKFPDMKTLQSWYRSNDYAELKEIRQSSSSSDIVAVNGEGAA